MNTIPLRVIVGPLGAGKTTLLKQLLIHRGHNEIHGVLVNDFGQIEVDKHRLQDDNLLIAALQGGCVCCSLQSRVQQALVSLVEAGATQLWLEPSGVADVRALYLALRKLPFIRLLPMIAVLPAKTLLAKQYSPILRAQLALANYVLVSHAENLAVAQQDRINEVLASLYPAKLAWAVGNPNLVPPDWLPHLGLAKAPDAQGESCAHQATAFMDHAITQPIKFSDMSVQHGLSQMGLVYPDLWQWSRLCLINSFSVQPMQFVKRVKGMLRTGPQHWYQVDWTEHGGWQWQESTYAGNSRLEVLHQQETVDWDALMTACQVVK
jgi:G3E family GTPase